MLARMPLTDDQLQELRQKLSSKGREVNDKILALQSGKTLPSGAADVPFSEVGEEPEARLKKFLAVIQANMKKIREGDTSYGKCAGCGAEIDAALLADEPWRDRCDACS
jgi:RNA polymerase-binding transcription factor DksA